MLVADPKTRVSIQDIKVERERLMFFYQSIAEDDCDNDVMTIYICCDDNGDVDYNHNGDDDDISNGDLIL